MLTAVALETSCSAGMLEVSTGRGPVGLQKEGAGLHPSPKMEIKPIENVTVQETDQSHRSTQTELFVLQL